MSLKPNMWRITAAYQNSYSKISSLAGIVVTSVSYNQKIRRSKPPPHSGEPSFWPHMSCTSSLFQVLLIVTGRKYWQIVWILAVVTFFGRPAVFTLWILILIGFDRHLNLLMNTFDKLKTIYSQLDRFRLTPEFINEHLHKLKTIYWLIDSICRLFHDIGCCSLTDWLTPAVNCFTSLID